ncbi:MAG: divalent-cation tolerance protein CutA [Alphaproteobacteria bacterium]|nr:divalent-cation tolerance protein CutA [Alphaproteobacteria bacterium]
MKTPYLFVYVTFETPEQAREICSLLVHDRLAACANIFPSHETLYWWNEELVSSKETAAIFKTTQGHFNNLKEKILKHHTYDCPCIVALPIQEGHEPFLSWIKQETAG